MINIIAVNPSVDMMIDLEMLNIGTINRSLKEQYRIGGKGINVAIMLNNLKTESTLYGFVGGFTGNAITSQLSEYPLIHENMIRVQDSTRINVKIKMQKETEINGKGPKITDQEANELLNQVIEFEKGDLVVITGSLAYGLDENFYLEIVKILKERNIEFVIDIDQPVLLEILPYNPLLIKPNERELRYIFKNMSDSLEHLSQVLLRKGAKNVLVSRGSKGSYLHTSDNIYSLNNYKGKVKDTVGSGDSMVAGFISSYIKDKNLEKAYELAVACGGATAFTDGIASAEFVESLLKENK